MSERKFLKFYRGAIYPESELNFYFNTEVGQYGKGIYLFNNKKYAFTEKDYFRIVKGYLVPAEKVKGFRVLVYAEKSLDWLKYLIKCRIQHYYDVKREINYPDAVIAPILDKEGLKLVDKFIENNIYELLNNTVREEKFLTLLNKLNFTKLICYCIYNEAWLSYISTD